LRPTSISFKQLERLIRLRLLLQVKKRLKADLQAEQEREKTLLVPQLLQMVRMIELVILKKPD
jgi:hypothetical protein